jgi:hypothetical protein
MYGFFLCHGHHSSLGILPSNEEMTQHPFVIGFDDSAPPDRLPRIASVGLVG